MPQISPLGQRKQCTNFGRARYLSPENDSFLCSSAYEVHVSQKGTSEQDQRQTITEPSTEDDYISRAPLTRRFHECPHDHAIPVTVKTPPKHICIKCEVQILSSHFAFVLFRKPFLQYRYVRRMSGMVNPVNCWQDGSRLSSLLSNQGGNPRSPIILDELVLKDQLPAAAQSLLMRKKDR